MSTSGAPMAQALKLRGAQTVPLLHAELYLAANGACNFCGAAHDGHICPDCSEVWAFNNAESRHQRVRRPLAPVQEAAQEREA